MYRNSEQQLQFENFKLPFDGNLRSDNRWVKLAKQIPWQEIEDLYALSLSENSKGPPALSVRVAFGALVIKERLSLSDEETVEQIRENPYLQYFLGLKEYEDEAIFHQTMFVHFRKRFSEDIINQINDLIAQKAMEATSKKSKKEHDKDDENTSDSGTENKGKLLVDATCAPEDINYQTDLKLLNKAREQSEQIMDTLHTAMPKGKKTQELSAKSQESLFKSFKEPKGQPKNVTQGATETDWFP